MRDRTRKRQRLAAIVAYYQGLDPKPETFIHLLMQLVCDIQHPEDPRQVDTYGRPLVVSGAGKETP